MIRTCKKLTNSLKGQFNTLLVKRIETFNLLLSTVVCVLYSLIRTIFFNKLATLFLNLIRGRFHRLRRLSHLPRVMEKLEFDFVNWLAVDILKMFKFNNCNLNHNLKPCCLKAENTRCGKVFWLIR